MLTGLCKRLFLFKQIDQISKGLREYHVQCFCLFFSGLILQDLTFINVGNQDYLPDGSINFAKRWQQFHILDSMRRFRDKKW